MRNKMAGIPQSIEREEISGEVVIIESTKGKFNAQIRRRDGDKYITVSNNEGLNESALTELVTLYQRKGYTITDERVVKTEEIEKPENTIDQYEALAKQVLQIPYTRKAYEKKMIELTLKNNNLEYRKKQIENAIYINVDQEKDKESKKIYTNEKARDAETKRRISEHTQYKEISTEQYKNTETQKEMQLEIDFLRRQMRSIGIVVELLKIKKQD